MNYPGNPYGFDEDEYEERRTLYEEMVLVRPHTNTIIRIVLPEPMTAFNAALSMEPLWDDYPGFLLQEMKKTRTNSVPHLDGG